MRAFTAGTMARFAVTLLAIGTVGARGGARNSDLSKYYESNRCGPIALYCICVHFDVSARIDEIAGLCGYRGRPVSIAALVAAAKNKGLSAEAYESSVRHLQRIGGPAIVDFPHGHFSVFLGWEGGKARIQDPPYPVRAVGADELQSDWGRHIIRFSLIDKRRSTR